MLLANQGEDRQSVRLSRLSAGGFGIILMGG